MTSDGENKNTCNINKFQILNHFDLKLQLIETFFSFSTKEIPLSRLEFV